jgi:glyoxylase-like metal-dependent hydrolase (beta-lactamase superfamily II)
MSPTRSLALALPLALLLSAAPRPAAAQQPPVQIVTTQLAPNFYAIDGQGGRMGALVGPDGVFIVDAQFPQVTAPIVAAIRKITDKPLRFLVNTHVHGDHTGGNENFAKLGVTIMARPELRDRLIKPAPPAAGAQPTPPAPPMALPVFTYDGPITLHMNGEAIELIPIQRAHTDGDTAVRFPMADVLMTGDVFRSTGFPNIDLANGGSLKGLLDGLATLAALAGPNTAVVPGHGAIVKRDAIVAHRDMVLAIRDRVRDLMASGKSADEVVAAKPTADYDAKTGNVAGSAERFVRQLYSELKDASTVAAR